MKKFTIAILLLAAFATKTMAQKESKKFSVGLGLEAGVPTGDASNLYTDAFGLSLRFSYHVGPGFITLTGTALGYLPKSVEGEPKKVGLEIPVNAGYKLIIAHHFFVMGEAGIVQFKSYYGDQGTLLSTSTSGVDIVPSIGVQFGVIELALRYQADLSDHAGLASFRLGFNF